ncbi:hypothetical protein [Acetobacterium sp.]|uniref:hypothetical protein n=1 Tax=Acetobacterium sp. TaxID=1872094 RepID=UPI003593E1CF
MENCGEYQEYAQTYLVALVEARRNDAIELILIAVNKENVSIEDLYIKIFTNVLLYGNNAIVKKVLSVNS